MASTFLQFISELVVNLINIIIANEVHILQFSIIHAALRSTDTGMPASVMVTPGFNLNHHSPNYDK